eukprot:5438849-Amphidinium_carterae.1
MIHPKGAGESKGKGKGKVGKGKRSTSQVSSGNEFEPEPRPVTARPEDQSSVIRVAVRVSCTHRLLIVLAVTLGFIVGRVTGSEWSESG